jgi:hypothetical protein
MVFPNTPPAHAADARPRCRQNSGVSLREYSDELKRELVNGRFKTAIDPMFKQVPSDLAVGSRPTRYIVTNYTETYMIPLQGTLTLGGLRYGYRFIALCQVKDTTGKSWLALADREKHLIYVPADRAEKASDYDEQVREEQRERRQSH